MLTDKALWDILESHGRLVINVMGKEKTKGPDSGQKISMRLEWFNKRLSQMDVVMTTVDLEEGTTKNRAMGAMQRIVAMHAHEEGLV